MGEYRVFLLASGVVAEEACVMFHPDQANNQGEPVVYLVLDSDDDGYWVVAVYASKSDAEAHLARDPFLRIIERVLLHSFSAERAVILEENYGESVPSRK